MSVKRSINGGNGRDVKGRFLPGNRHGKGNPLVKQTTKLRAVLMEAVTPEDMRQVVLKLVAMAKSGDAVAIRELLNRVYGRPVEPRLDLTEVLTREERIQHAKDLLGMKLLEVKDTAGDDK